MPRVVVGLSGGVDSAVAAYLLRAMGYDVIGITLRTWLPDGGTESRCCEIGEAEKIASFLNIPYYVRNAVSPFYNAVAVPFFADYLHGKTPNPCVLCNPRIKFAGLLEAADTMHAAYAATGHYAVIKHCENDRLSVMRAQHVEKDQSYMLCRLTQQQIARTLFPLGALSKAEVRSIAEQIGLPAAKRPDSQEICFVPDGSYADLIAAEHPEALPAPGDFVDQAGNVVGRHQGIHRYTVGQRRGLGLALGEPVYVLGVDAAHNTVRVGPESALFASEITCRNLHFMGLSPEAALQDYRCAAKIRYRHPAAECTVTRAETDLLRVRFMSPVRAPAPGQTAVFYAEDGSILMCGVII